MLLVTNVVCKRVCQELKGSMLSSRQIFAEHEYELVADHKYGTSKLNQRQGRILRASADPSVKVSVPLCCSNRDRNVRFALLII
jgi:hypothetical protein